MGEIWETQGRLWRYREAGVIHLVRVLVGARDEEVRVSEDRLDGHLEVGLGVVHERLVVG